MTVTQVQSFSRVLQLLPEIYKALCSSSKTTVSIGFWGNAKAKKKEVEWSKECEEAFLN